MSWSCPRCGGSRDGCRCSHDTELLEEILAVLLEIRDLIKQPSEAKDE
jgi:hypothetical protein